METVAPTKPKEELRFTIAGLIKEQESGLGVPGLIVRAYDKDLLFDDLLGSTITDDEGRFEISYSLKDFRELFESKPDLYLTVYAPPSRRLTDTSERIRWNASAREEFELVISREILGDLSPQIPPDQVIGSLGLEKEDFRLERRDGFEIPRIDGFVLGGTPGAPALPEQVHFVALPLGAEILALEEIPGVFVEIGGLKNLMPLQEPVPDVGVDAKEFGDGFTIDNTEIDFTAPDAAYYEAKRPYPDKLVELVGVEDVGVIRIAMLRLRPVRFDPAARSLQFFPDLGFRLSFDIEKARRGAEERQEKKTGVTRMRTEVLQSLLYCETMHSARELHWPPFELREEAPHVIITDNYSWPERIESEDGSTRAPKLSERGAALTGDLIEEFERLAEWKTSRGVRSRVVSISDIVEGKFGDMTMGGLARDLQEVLRTFSKYVHDRWDTTYLLLGGDLNVVPMRHLVGSSTYKTIGCSARTENPPLERHCHFIASTSVVKLRPMFTPAATDPLSTLNGGLRIPFDRQAGSGRLGWYFTSETEFNNRDEGFARLPAGTTSRFVIVEGPASVIDDSYYWVRSVNSIPSDLYYSSLVGSGYSRPGKHDFDDNNNGLYAQFHGTTGLDKVDLWPDVFVGRASVETEAQARAFVDKVITYERLETPDGEVTVDPTYLQKILYASAYWGRKWQSRQADTTVPPAEKKFTHLAGTTESRIRTDFDLVLSGGVPDRRLVARLAASQIVVAYDTGASATRLGWYFTTDGTYSVQSATPTRFILVCGPEPEIDANSFFWDPVGLELSVNEKEYLRGRMNNWFSDFNSIERHYEDYFDLAAPPSIVPLESATVTASIDNGVHFLSMSGHGSSGGCCGVSSGHNYTNDNKFFIGFGDSCSTARPDGVDSLAETTTTDADGGAVAYIGNTRYGWIGVGDNYEQFFWSKLSSMRRVGPAAGYRLATAGVQSMWTTYAQTLFGDPEMPVWTKVPDSYEVTHPSQATWGDTFSVTVRRLGLPLAGQNVTIMGGWSTSSSRPPVFETKRTESTGMVSFQLPASGTPLSSVRLTVSGWNFKPFVVNIPVTGS